MLKKMPVISNFTYGHLELKSSQYEGVYYNGVNFKFDDGELVPFAPSEFVNFDIESYNATRPIDLLGNELTSADALNKVRSSNDVLVIYHGGCPDGVASASVIYSVLEDKATYLAGSYGKSIFDEFDNLNGKTIIFADFSYPTELMTTILDQAEFVVMLDHHKSALLDLEQVLNTAHVYSHCSIEYCGASLAWDFFRKGEKTPEFIKYIEDGDLYTFQLPNARNIVKGIHASLDQEATKNCIYLFDHYFAQKVEQFAFIGEKLLVEANRHSSFIIKKGRQTVTAFGHTFPLVNANQEHVNLIGETLIAEPTVPFVMIYNLLSDGVKVSVRSNAEKVDSAVILKQFCRSSGGHHSAAGGLADLDVFLRDVLAHAKQYVVDEHVDGNTCSCC